MILGVPFPGRGIEEDDIFSCSLNIKKLHEYPGFNAPCPPDVIDVSIIAKLLGVAILFMYS